MCTNLRLLSSDNEFRLFRHVATEAASGPYLECENQEQLAVGWVRWRIALKHYLETNVMFSVGYILSDLQKSIAGEISVLFLAFEVACETGDGFGILPQNWEFYFF